MRQTQGDAVGENKGLLLLTADFRVYCHRVSRCFLGCLFLEWSVPNQCETHCHRSLANEGSSEWL
ncbi:unnamed protein product [Ceratitis capitata]|uniref:(Mediterranean fruit fly) hypothetical protein n=1 Tax=Ceratitis capitata TaxID=7213 RepID=A0A811VBA0_CERCA|nr:unnamed protein product [Ceratitis capitata]